MKLDCTTDFYDLLYARWLQNPGVLLDEAGWEPGMTLLDLCGGTGAVSFEAIRRGAKDGQTVLLDRNPRCTHPWVRGIQGEAVEAPRIRAEFCPRGFDVIVCRQAMGYLDPKAVGLSVYEALAPGGRFVFNTFSEPHWQTKTYNYEGRRYIEVAGHLLDRVLHVQGLCSPRRPFLTWDVSTFRYHLPVALYLTMEDCAFFVRWHVNKQSVHFICTRLEGQKRYE